MSTITVGSYYHGSSVLHRMDPRVKIALMLVYMVSVFIAPMPQGMIPVCLLAVIMCVASRVPFKVINKACKPLWPFVIIAAFFNIFLVRTGEPAFVFLGFTITDQALALSVLMAARIFVLMLSGVIFSLTTSPIAITDGAERLLSPLERFGLPVHQLAMIFTIALRFVPTLFDELNHIMVAQAARGAAMDEGRLIDRLKFFVPILVPLFASALRHAEELAAAMEARCYVGGEGRTHFHILKIERRDRIAIAIWVIYLASLAALAIVMGGVGVATFA